MSLCFPRRVESVLPGKASLDQSRRRAISQLLPSSVLGKRVVKSIPEVVERSWTSECGA